MLETLKIESTLGSMLIKGKSVSVEKELKIDDQKK